MAEPAIHLVGAHKASMCVGLTEQQIVWHRGGSCSIPISRSAVAGPRAQLLPAAPDGDRMGRVLEVWKVVSQDVVVARAPCPGAA